jgi:hypothetical protein
MEDTTRPKGFEPTPRDLRKLAARMREDASRWLARANDLEQAAARMEGSDHVISAS